MSIFLNALRRERARTPARDTTRKRLTCSLLATTALAAAVAGAAHAQEALLQPSPPTRETVDPRGVDLVSGMLTFTDTGLTIGTPGDGGLSFSRSFTGNAWRDSYVGVITVSGSTYTVSVGGSSEAFTGSGGSYAPQNGGGSTLTQSGGSWTYTTGNGTKYLFDAGGTYNDGPWGNNVGRISQISKPDGETITFEYGDATACNLNTYGPCPDGQDHDVSRLSAYQSNFGYIVFINYEVDTAPVAQRNHLFEVQSVSGQNLASGTQTAVVTFSPSGTSTRTITDPAGRTHSYTYDGAGRITAMSRGGAGQITLTYDGAGRVQTVNDGLGTWTYAYADAGSQRTTTVTDPNGKVRTVVSDLSQGLVTSDADPLGRTTTYAHDGQGRLTQVTAPEGDAVQYGYDGRGNVVQKTSVPKPNSGLANIVTTASYDGSCDPGLNTLNSYVKCNKPNATVDANGHQTDYAYSTNMGGLLTVTRPADVNGNRPQTRYAYANLQPTFSGAGGPIWRLANVTSCNTNPNCAGTTDESKTAIGYDVQNNLRPFALTRSAGDGSSALTSYVGYDIAGDVTSSTDPRGSVTNYTFDAARNPVMTIAPDSDGSGPLPRLAVTLTYDGAGRVVQADKGVTTSPTGADFSPQERTTATYDGAGRLTQTAVGNGLTTSAPLSLTQYAYDNVGRPTCTAVRLNPAAFGVLPDACSQSANGADGPDQITKLVYNDAGEVTEQREAVGTGSEQAYGDFAYTPDGQLASFADARGNGQSFTYDGFNRLYRTNYPYGPFEQNDYDPNGNVVRFTNREGFQIQLAYDSLSRLISEKGITNGTPDTSIRWWDLRDRVFAYDLAGRLTQADNDQWYNHWTYDALGRPATFTNNFGPSYFSWDGSGNLVSNSLPDGFRVGYAYDGMNRTSYAEMQAVGGGTVPVAWIGYDALGRRSSVSFADGSTQSYAYDGADRLTSLAHAFPADGGHNVTLTYAYDAAGRQTRRNSTNPAFVYAPSSGATSFSPADAWSRFFTVNGSNLDWFGTGVPTNDAAHGFYFDELNQLAYLETHSGASPSPWSPSGAPDNEAFVRDALGEPFGTVKRNPGFQDTLLYRSTNGLRSEEVLDRLYKTPNGSPDNWAYVGDRIYVPGPNADERLAFFDMDGTIRYPHTDERGSTIALSQGGTAAAVFNYGPSGETPAQVTVDAGALGYPFRYTGQRLDGWSGLYDYKARAYSPSWGRFLQPDPIGIGDGLHLYRYAHNDPVNATDPSGLSCNTPPGAVDCVEVDAPKLSDSASNTGEKDAAYNEFRQALDGLQAPGGTSGEGSEVSEVTVTAQRLNSPRVIKVASIGPLARFGVNGTPIGTFEGFVSKNTVNTYLPGGKDAAFKKFNELRLKVLRTRESEPAPVINGLRTILIDPSGITFRDNGDGTYSVEVPGGIPGASGIDRTENIHYTDF